MVDDFDMFNLDIQGSDAVAGDAGQSMGPVHDKHTQNWDKFDKTLVKKRVDLSVIRQAQNCLDYVACKNQMGESFRVIPLGNLRVYEGPETRNRPKCSPLELHKLIK